MNQSTTKSQSINTSVKDVLFQKIGQTWYIFSEVNNEIVYSVMPQGMDPKTTRLELYEVIEEHLSKVASNKKRNQEIAA